MRQLIVVFITVLFGTTELHAQKDPVWDNSLTHPWDSPFRLVEIASSADGALQRAYLYASRSKSPKPLIVSLHTWSGDYSQKDPLTREILARDWNYIHPDFRGPNNKPDAGCSELVLSDIEDAIQYALKNTNSDEVHIIGVSGGGLATLFAYMNISYPVKSFSAWAPISDLESWYWESVGRKQKYASDILKIVSPDSVFDQLEARKRSPLFQHFPADARKNAQLYIYVGIHDGYEGSVPSLRGILDYYAEDGIHMVGAGQEIIASRIVESISTNRINNKK